MRELIERYGLSVRVDVAAEIAGFSDDKVRELRRAGRFPGHRAGTKVMVFVPGFVEWMRNGGEAQYEPPPGQPGRRRDHERRPSRKADHPAWMDRVGAPTPPNP